MFVVLWDAAGHAVLYHVAGDTVTGGTEYMRSKVVPLKRDPLGVCLVVDSLTFETLTVGL